MNSPPAMTMALPRPGRALVAVMVLIAVLGIGNALLATWVPGGVKVFQALAFEFDAFAHGQLWRVLTSGLLTSPERYSHLIFTLLGFYFLAPDLERRWGDARMLRFLAFAVVFGNLLAFAFDRFTPDAASGLFHPGGVFGAGAALAAIGVAWSRANADRTVNVLFIIPVRGRHLLWVVVGFCVLDLIYPRGVPEGAIAPFGGVLTGLLLSGNPSPLRAAWLHLKLALLRRRATHLSPEDVVAGKARRPPRPGAPPLRVVPGGLDDVLKKRQPPKDKRYLN